jgi:hypothetical protein
LSAPLNHRSRRQCADNLTNVNYFLTTEGGAAICTLMSTGP